MKPGMAKPKLDLIIRTSPITPDLISSTSFRVCGCSRYMKASPRKVPALRAAWIIASASKAVSAKRLLAQHMLAGFGRLDRPFGVAGMRRRDVDRVDSRIGEQGIVAVEDARARKGLGEAGLAGIARADCREQCRCANAPRRRRRPWRCCRVRGCPSGFFAMRMSL